MTKLPDGISAQSISLQTKNDFHFSQVTIKNGFLWGKNQENHLVHADLNNKTNAVVEELTSYGEIDFYSVCQCGEMCYVKTKARINCNYVFTCDKKIYKINVPPDCIPQKAAWISLKNRPKPYLFLNFNIKDYNHPGVQFCYFNFDDKHSYFHPVMLNPPIPGKILGLNLLQYDNQKIGASFLIHDEQKSSPYNLYPAVFKNDTFIASDDYTANQVAYMPIYSFTKNNLYFLENQYAGISTDKIFYTILLDPSKDVSITNILNNMFVFDVDHNADKIFISNNIIYQFVKNELSFFLINKDRKEQAINCVKLYDDQIFEVDTYSSIIYSISNSNVIIKYKFDSNIITTGLDS